MDDVLGTMRIAGTVRHSSVDGPGVRYTVFFQGCPHHCRGCHNPDTLDPDGGEEAAVSALIGELHGTRYLDGVTLSGGEPLMQPSAVIAIADAAHEKGLSVWCYTGWTFEEVMRGDAGEGAVEALGHIDVLVDGSFIEGLAGGIYRGSGNQRLVHVPVSLDAGKAFCIEM